MPGLVKLFIYGSLDARAERVAKRENITTEKAIDKIKSADKRRQNYYNYHADRKWGEAQNYNLCIDSSFCGVEKAADIICDFVSKV